MLKSSDTERLMERKGPERLRKTFRWATGSHCQKLILKTVLIGKTVSGVWDFFPISFSAAFFPDSWGVNRKHLFFPLRKYFFLCLKVWRGFLLLGSPNIYKKAWKWKSKWHCLHHPRNIKATHFFSIAWRIISFFSILCLSNRILQRF